MNNIFSTAVKNYNIIVRCLQNFFLNEFKHFKIGRLSNDKGFEKFTKLY